MTAGKRGLISLAAAVFLALSSVLPAYAQEEMPDELETAETIPEQNSDPPSDEMTDSDLPADEPAKPPETQTQTDPYYEENNTSSSKLNESDQETSQQEESPSSANDDEESGNASQANEETENKETDEPDGTEKTKNGEDLELTDEEVSLILESNPDHSTLSRIEDYENDDINALAKANEQDVIFMAAYEIDPKLPDQTVEFKAEKSLLENIDYDELELYSIDEDKIESLAFGKEIKTDPDSIEASFDAKSLGLLVFAALKKSDKEAQSQEEELMALADEGDLDPQANGQPYPCYFYAKTPQRSGSESLKHWVGLGIGSVSGNALPDPSTATAYTNPNPSSSQTTNYLAQATDIVSPNQISQTDQRDYNPNNSFNGQFYNGYPIVYHTLMPSNQRVAFRFREMNTTRPSVGGYYNLHWDILFVGNTDAFNVGNNAFWTDNPVTGSSKAYRMNGTIYLNENFYTVSYRVKEPGSASFSNPVTMQSGENATPDDLIIPDSIPETKTVNGKTYRLSKWYTNEGMTDEFSTLTGNTTLYAQYIQVQTVEVFLREAGAADYTKLSDTVIPNGDLLQTAVPANLPATELINNQTYRLKGWYSDPNLTQQVDLSSPVTADQSIYAAYLPEYTVKYFTRTLGGQYPDPDNPDKTVKILQGDSLATLEDPSGIDTVNTRTSKVLSFWYTDQNLQTKLNPAGTANGNIDLYAEYGNATTILLKKETNPPGLTSVFDIHLFGVNSKGTAKSPIRPDPGSTSKARYIGSNEIDATLRDGESATIWIPLGRATSSSTFEGGVLRVLEDNPGATYVQHYRWGNFVGDLSSLDTNPLTVTGFQTLTIYNSLQTTPEQPVYLYGQIQTGGTTQTYGLAEGTIAGPLVFPAAQQTIQGDNLNYKGTTLGNNIRPLVTDINRPASFPDLDIGGVTYSYLASLPTTPFAAGNYYTLNWLDPITIESQIAPGINNVFPASQTKNYRQNANIVLHRYTTFTLDSKNVDGTGDADPDYAVTYTVAFSGNIDPVMPRSSSGNPSGGTTFSVTLKSGQSASFNVPVGTTVQITDSVDSSLYKPSWSSSSGPSGDGATTSAIPINGPTTVTFTNTRDLIVPTDFESKSPLPYLLLLSMLAGLFLLMTRRKKI